MRLVPFDCVTPTRVLSSGDHVAASGSFTVWYGGVIGGSSAGAAVISSLMIIGGATADTESVRAGATKLTAGLGLWPKVIVDQHFVARRRFTGLLAAVLDHPELVGIGIDEDTAVLVSGDRFEVLGSGTVLVIDARGAKVRASATG